jgi:AcrR family transcriptional regulator
VDGDETRRGIIAAARSCFAAHGYSATTNRMIADAANITSAAVYHHFGQKHELMLAVHEATEQAYVARMQAAVDEVEGFLLRVQTLFRVIHEVVVEDPEQVAFAAIARDEARRHPELAPIENDRTYAEIFDALADYGVRTGEVRRRDSAQVRSAIAAMATGLAMLGGTMSADRHALATEGCCRLVAGELLVSSPS